MKKTNRKPETRVLRQKAEEIISSIMPVKYALKSWMSEPDALKLIHELEIHQVELGLQNDELQLSIEKADAVSEKYENLFEFAPSGYLTLAQTGEIVELNLCASQLLGKERSKLINKPFCFFVSDTSKPIYNQFLSNIFNKGIQQTCDLTLLTDRHESTYVHLTGIITKNQELFINIVNITERKSVEENLRISEKKYRNLVENALVGIYTTTIKGKYVYVNDALRKILEYDSIEELINSDLESDYKNANDRIILIETIKKQEKIIDYEVELLTKKGKTINVLINSFLNGDEITGMIMDISDRKQVEEDMKNRIEELQSFHNLTIGRELIMIELKKEVNDLLLKSGQKEKYKIVG